MKFLELCAGGAQDCVVLTPAILPVLEWTLTHGAPCNDKDVLSRYSEMLLSTHMTNALAQWDSASRASLAWPCGEGTLGVACVLRTARGSGWSGLSAAENRWGLTQLEAAGWHAAPCARVGRKEAHSWE